MGYRILIALIVVAFSGGYPHIGSCKDEINRELLRQSNDGDGNIALSGMDQETRKLIENLFQNPQGRLDQIGASLQGYAKLLEDIENGTYPCIKKNDLERYDNSEWSLRTLGFKNWETSLRGYLLLQRANSLKYQLIIMGQSKDEKLKAVTEKKELELEKILSQILDLTKTEHWAE